MLIWASHSLALGLVQGEVEERPLGPGDRCVPTTDPAIVFAVITTPVIRHGEVQAEAVAVEGHGAIEIADFENDGDEPVLLRHQNIMSTDARAVDPAVGDGSATSRARRMAFARRALI